MSACVNQGLAEATACTSFLMALLAGCKSKQMPDAVEVLATNRVMEKMVEVMATLRLSKEDAFFFPMAGPPHHLKLLFMLLQTIAFLLQCESLRMCRVEDKEMVSLRRSRPKEFASRHGSLTVSQTVAQLTPTLLPRLGR